MSVRPGIWQVVCQDAAGMLDIPADVADDVPPVYAPVDEALSSTLEDLPSTMYHSCSFLQMEVHETFTHTYDLAIGDSQVQVIILVESDQELDRPDHYVFSLSVRIGRVERAIAKPVTMKLSIDPGGLDFIVYAFVPRASLPPGCLYHLRVWLRSAGIDHRVFGERDLWFGRDPDFRAITDASFASLQRATKDMSIYQGTVGRAHVSFILRWTPVEPHVYMLSLEYEAGGVGRTLFENYHLRLDCDTRMLSFLIYSIPIPSTPAGASHRLRLWLRTPCQEAPESYLYQGLWRSDDLKIGAQLRFDVGHQLILATRTADTDAPSAGGLGRVPLTSKRRSRLVPAAGVDGEEESVDDV